MSVTTASHLDGAQVLVLGLGESGLAMARWCGRLGARLRVWDSREAPPNAAALAAAVPDATWLRGPLTEDACRGVQLVVKSPGLSPLDERIAGPLRSLVDIGVPVQGELDLFARALVDLKAGRGYAPQVLAITGTNGKTTTTSMAAQLIARTGRRVAVAGNIGPTMLQTLMDALDREPAVDPVRAVEADAPGLALADPSAAADADAAGSCAAGDAGSAIEAIALRDGTETAEASATIESDADDADTWVEAGAPQPADALDDDATAEKILPVVAPPPAAPTFLHLPEVWVLELSSFQLDGVQGFEPSAAVVLNLTEDHLDWHGSMAAYVAAKARVYGQRAVMVVNRDDARVEALVPAVPDARAARAFKGRGRTAPPARRQVVRFGMDAPRRAGDFGLMEESGIAWLVRAREQDETLSRSRGGKGTNAADAEEIHIQRLMPADALRVRGRHNAANALAALALATAIGCPLAPMLHGLREYRGEPHRLQFVASAGGVDAYDDSKGTNVGATVAALDGLGADRAPAKLAVVLGGDGKGQDFAPLAGPVRRHARAVGLIGRDAAAIQEALAASGVPLQRHETLEAATRWCFEQARPGDAVLLSPACASLDMFRHYGHRAEVFIAEVLALASEAGGVAA